MTVGALAVRLSADRRAVFTMACPVPTCIAPVGERCRQPMTRRGLAPWRELDKFHRARRTAAARAGVLYPPPKES